MKKREISSLQIVCILTVMLSIPLFMEAQVTESGYFWTDLDGNCNFEPCEFAVSGNTDTSRTEPLHMPGWPINIGSGNNKSPSGICLADINGDGLLEIIAGSTNGVFHVWDYLGNDLPGWPKTGLNIIQSKAAVGDIDSDYPGLEIIVAGHQNRLYAWHNDGTAVAGWPLTVASTEGHRSPVLFDIDGDGSLEIILGQRVYPDGQVIVYNHDGTIYPGWPQPMDCVATPSVADVDNDGVVEICAVSFHSIYLWDKDGNPEPGWPLLDVAGRADYASPALADLDGDGDLEILHAYYDQPGAGSTNHVAIYHHDGTYFDNWPQNFPGSHTFLTPVVGDIDNDGDLEVFNGGHSFDLGARHHTGETVAGWPVTTTAALECSPIVFDLDNGGYRDVVFGENMWDPYGDFWAFSGDGSLLEDWPIDIVHATMVNSAAVGDVDGDGDIEIALIVANGTVYLWTLEDIPYRKYLTEWGTYHHDNWNTGWFHPLAPQNPTAFISGNSVHLSWNTNTEPDLSGYNVYRSDIPGGPYTKINNELIVETNYIDASGTSNDFYCITAEIMGDAESRLSNEAIFQTSWIEGIVSLEGGAGNVEEVIVSAGSVSTNPDAGGFYSIGIGPGTYDVTATLEYYDPDTVAGVIVEEGVTTSGVDLILVFNPPLNPPQNVQVNPYTGLVTWDPPIPVPGVTLLGYNIYLDGCFMVFTTSTQCQLPGLIYGVVYSLGISAIYDLGESDIVILEFTYMGTGTDDDILCYKTELIGNYPNPFNPTTTIEFTTENTEKNTEIIIYNLKGQIIRQYSIFPDQSQAPYWAGNIQSSIVWDGTDDSNQPVSSGIYFYQLKAGNEFSETKLMLLLK